jgi:Haem-binding domain
MSGKIKRASVVFVVVFVAAQLVRPSRVNPPIDPGRTIQAHVGTTSALAAVLNRSSRLSLERDRVALVHTIAPVSWLMASGVAKGRNAVNFSEWGSYSPDVRRTLLSASCEDVSSGKMPGPYTFVRPETRLSARDIGTICTAARLAEAQAFAGGTK